MPATTDIWAAIFPVGDDGGASRRRTRALLQELAAPDHGRRRDG